MPVVYRTVGIVWRHQITVQTQIVQNLLAHFALTMVVQVQVQKRGVITQVILKDAQQVPVHKEEVGSGLPFLQVWPYFFSEKLFE